MASPLPGATGPAEPVAPASGALPGSPAYLIAVLVVTAVACGVGAWLGAWWLPFLAGVTVAVLAASRARTGRRVPRGGVLAALVGAAGGWLIVLWVLALDGQPVGATSRAIAALAGLPPYAGVTVAVAALLAVLQVLSGAWLARAVLPRRKPAPDEPQAAGGPRTLAPRTPGLRAREIPGREYGSGVTAGRRYTPT